MAILRSQRQVPTEEWDRRDEWWFDTELARLELARRVRAGAKSMDMLICSLVAKAFVGDRLFSDDHKTTPGGASLDVAIFNKQTGRWELSNADVAAHAITTVCHSVVEDACGD